MAVEAGAGATSAEVEMVQEIQVLALAVVALMPILLTGKTDHIILITII